MQMLLHFLYKNMGYFSEVFHCVSPRAVIHLCIGDSIINSAALPALKKLIPLNCFISSAIIDVIFFKALYFFMDYV